MHHSDDLLYLLLLILCFAAGTVSRSALPVGRFPVLWFAAGFRSRSTSTAFVPERGTFATSHLVGCEGTGGAGEERDEKEWAGKTGISCTLQSAPCVFKSVLRVDFLTFAYSSFCLRPSSADSSADSRSSWAGGLPLDEDIDESEADVGAAGEAFISRSAQNFEVNVFLIIVSS